MAYDRYDTRRDWRGDRSRWQGDDRPERGWNNDRDRSERGWFERAGDEIASWFGDDEAERRQRQDDRGGGRERFAGHLRNDDDVRSYYGHRDHDREFFGRNRDTSFRRDRGDSGRNRDDRAFLSDEDFRGAHQCRRQLRYAHARILLSAHHRLLQFLYRKR